MISESVQYEWKMGAFNYHDNNSNWQKYICMVAFFVTGSLEAVIIKLLYIQKVTGFHNIIKHFERPWFQVWIMFFTMSLHFFLTPFFKFFKCQKYRIGDKYIGWGLFRICSIIALCDLSATVLQFISLKFLDTSFWQMMRAFVLLFTILFSILLRKKKFSINDWIGISIATIGIIVSGIFSYFYDSDIINSKSFGTRKILAIFVTILSQLIQAYQTILEEDLLHDDDAHWSEILGYAGVWGFYLTTTIAWPLVNILPDDNQLFERIYENSKETFFIFGHSWRIVLMEFALVVVTFFYNMTGMMITQYKNAIHRNIFEALKTMGVWLFSLILYKTPFRITNHFKWESFLQLIGFLLIIIGSLMYNHKIEFRYCKKEESGLDTQLLIEKK